MLLKGLSRSVSIIQRQFHNTNVLKINCKAVEEIKIPVPWGHIAGKWWGDKNVVPVIALHGMQDNAATFDRLAPLLEMPSLLCLDVPGHGLSSHIPEGLTLHYLDNILYLRHVLKNHFKLDEQLTLLGHSFGASLWFTYSALFHGSVSRVILIESALYNMAMMTSKTVQDMRVTIDTLIDLPNRPIQERTFDELLTYMLDVRSRNFPLSESAARILLTRSAKKLPSGKYIFSGDPRLGVRYLGRLTNKFILELSSRIDCKVLNIRAEKGIPPSGEPLETCLKSLEIMKKTAKHLDDIIVKGGHHVHLESPEEMAAIINKFINTQ